MAKWRALILLIFCDLVVAPLLAQEPRKVVQPEAVDLWAAWFSPAPPEVIDGKVGETWTGSGYQGQAQPSKCFVPDEIQKAAQELFDAAKQFYQKKNYSKELEDIEKNEPKKCAEDIVRYRLWVARRTLQWAASQ